MRLGALNNSLRIVFQSSHFFHLQVEKCVDAMEIHQTSEPQYLEKDNSHTYFRCSVDNNNFAKVHAHRSIKCKWRRNTLKKVNEREGASKGLQTKNKFKVSYHWTCSHDLTTIVVFPLVGWTVVVRPAYAYVMRAGCHDGNCFFIGREMSLKLWPHSKCCCCCSFSSCSTNRTVAGITRTAGRLLIMR